MSGILVYFYFLILAFGGFAITDYFMSLFLTRRELHVRWYVLWALSFIGLTVYFNFMEGKFPNPIFVFYYMTYVFLFFKGKWYHKIFLLILESLCLYVLEVVFNATMSLLGNVHYSSIIKKNKMLFEGLVNGFEFSVALVYYLLSRKNLVPKKIKTESFKLSTWIILAVIGFITMSFSIMIDMNLRSLESEQLAVTTIYLLLSLFMVLVVLIGGAILIGKISSSAQLKYENALIEKHLENQLKHYHQLENNMTQIRSIKHDMRNHLITLEYLIKEESFKQAQEYISGLNNRVQESDRDIFTGNTIFDAIIFEKKGVAKQNRIDFIFEGNLCSEVLMNPVDLCTIISNSIDNAIEACIQLNESKSRTIHVESKVKDNHWFYTVKNTTLPVVIPIGGFPKTQKADKKAHGFGLYNIRESVYKYEGLFEIKTYGEEFHLEIVIKIAGA